MCVYSAITNQMFPGGPHDPWVVPKTPIEPWVPSIPPFPNPYPSQPGIPTINPMFPKDMYPNMIPWGTVTPELAKQILQILTMLEALDKRLGNLECLVEEKVKKAIVEKLEGIANGNPQPNA